MNDQLYCHVGEISKAQKLTDPVPVNRYFEFIRTASQWLNGEQGLDGDFIPVTDTLRFDGPRDGKYLFVNPLLSVTSIIDDTTTLVAADYLLYPRNKHWRDGPHTSIQIDPDSTNITSWTKELDIVVITGTWGKYNKTIDIAVTLSTTMNSSITTIEVSDGGLIYPGMTLFIDTEQILVTGLSDLMGGVFVCERAANGTTAASHTSGATINRYIPPKDVSYLCRQIVTLMEKKEASGFAGKTGSVDTGDVFYHVEFPRAVIKEIRANYDTNARDL